MIKQYVLSFSLLCSTFLGGSSSRQLSEYGPSLVASVNYKGILYTLSLPHTVFGLRQNLTGSFQVQNLSEDERTFHFSDMQQLSYILSSDLQDTVMLEPTQLEFSESELVLAPGEKKIYPIKAAFRDMSDEPLKPGEYLLKAFLRNNAPPQVSVLITLQPFPPLYIHYE